MRSVITPAFMFLLTYLCGDSYCVTYNRTVDLGNRLLAGYDTRLRPVLNQSSTLRVGIGLVLGKIRDFDEVGEKFSVFGIVRVSWRDQLITWDPKRNGGISSLVFRLSDIWYPKIILENRYSDLPDLGEDWMTVRVNKFGAILFESSTVFETTCSADITYYPFDTQRCGLSFRVWGYSRSEVNLLRWGKVISHRFVDNGEWTLIDTNIHSFLGSKFTSQSIEFLVTIKRKPTFIIINVILPNVFMAVINVLVFLLPVESGERISYSVTVLLAIAVFMTLVGENLPKTSETMPILSYYLMILLILSTLVTVTTILNLKMFFKKGKVPACLRFLFRILFCFPCRFRKKKIDQVNKVDVVPAITEDNLSKEEPEITWQEISVAVDRIALAVFFLGTIAVNAVFLVILAKNKDVAFNEK